MNRFNLQAKEQKGVLSGLRLGLCAVLLLILLLPAELLLGQTTTTHYDVGGTTLKEVKNNIWGPNGSGPRDPEGHRHAGSASLTYSYNYAYTCSSLNGACMITITPVSSITTNLGCEILLPNWTGYDSATQAEKQEWDRFIAALTTHEQGHCDRYLTDANRQAFQNAVAAALGGQSIDISLPCPEDCSHPDSAFKEAVQSAVQGLLDNNQGVQNVLNQMEQVQQQYDTDTRHGETQGATLHDP